MPSSALCAYRQIQAPLHFTATFQLALPYLSLDSHLHLEKTESVRCLAAYALLWTFLLIGSGALEYMHNWAHELEDRLSDQVEAAAAPTYPSNLHPLPIHREHEHDENNCEVHAQIHMAIILNAWVPLLIRLGIWIAFLTLLAVPLIPRLLPARIDCRGPPLTHLLNSF
jgi:hypothetical protein